MKIETNNYVLHATLVAECICIRPFPVNFNGLANPFLTSAVAVLLRMSVYPGLASRIRHTTRCVVHNGTIAIIS
jgi:hypothetical protein